MRLNQNSSSEIASTIYVSTLYRIAGRDYCRHHTIRAAVAVGHITEVKPGAGPVSAMPRGGPAPDRSLFAGRRQMGGGTLYHLG